MVKVLIQHGKVHEIFGETAPELHADLLVVDAPNDVECGWFYDGEGGFTVPESAPEPTYKELRAVKYPSIEDQLDMQYWDSINGTTTWVDAIAAVKAEYSKD